jgi:hypothetical protein
LPEFAREVTNFFEVMPHFGLIPFFAFEGFEFHEIGIEVQCGQSGVNAFGAKDADVFFTIKLDHALEIPLKESRGSKKGESINGRAIEKTFEWPQLIDNFNLNFLEVGESAEKLAVLRVKKQLSMRQLSKETGHSLSYLRQQLREFGIAQEKSDQGLQPYGWRMVDRKLIPVENEQRIICEMIQRAKAGENSGDICRSLNKRNVPSKTGGKWWPSSIRRILARERKRTTSFAKINPS